jgi:ATP-dependent protease ClpP protease subunit
MLEADFESTTLAIDGSPTRQVRGWRVRAAASHRRCWRLRKQPSHRTSAEQRLITATWAGIIGDTITTDVATRLLRNLSPRQSFDVTITSPGGSRSSADRGSVVASQGIIQMLVPAFASSAALRLLVIADRRVCAPGAEFIVQNSEISADTSRMTAPTMRQIADATETRDRHYNRHLAVACGCSTGRIEALAHAEERLNARQAKCRAVGSECPTLGTAVGGCIFGPAAHQPARVIGLLGPP